MLRHAVYVPPKALVLSSMLRYKEQKGTSMRALSTLVIVVVLSGYTTTSWGDLSLAELASANQSRLAQLSVGMNKNDVIALMGSRTAKTRDGVVNNPWTAETFVGKDGAQVRSALLHNPKKPAFYSSTKIFGHWDCS